MKSPVQAFRPELERSMHAAREVQAKTLFDPVTVKSMLTKAAGDGHAYCVLPVPLDLRETTAAQTILAWCGRESLETDWSQRPPAEAHGEATYDLVISWRAGIAA